MDNERWHSGFSLLKKEVTDKQGKNSRMTYAAMD